MVDFTVMIKFDEGLHARPATELVKICKGFTSDIRISKNDAVIDPKGILGILTLGACKNDEIQVKINGADETHAAQALQAYFG